MESPSVNPIASLERLHELGLDQTKFGSCSESQGRQGWRGKIEKYNNAGCEFWHECKWKNVPMPDKTGDNGETVMRPRPRMVKTRLIKPKRDGSGKDAIIQSYCTCAQWHRSLKKRHGSNGEIAEVTGGEGDSVTLMGSIKMTRDAEGNLVDPYYKQTFFKKTIPAFLDPTDNPELITDVFAGMVRKEEGDRAEQAILDDRDRRMKVGRMGGEPKAGDLGEGSLVDDLQKAIKAGNQSSP